MAQSRRDRLAAPPDPTEAALDAMADMPDRFVECRSERFHNFPRNAPFRLVDTDKEDRAPRRGHRQFVERRRKCRVCGTVRIDLYAVNTRNGRTALTRIGNPDYDRPDGYSVPGIGHAAGLTELLLGARFDQQMRDGR